MKPYLRTSAIVSSSGEISWALLKSETAAWKYFHDYVMQRIVLKALRRGTASDPVGMARRRLGGRLGEQGDAL